jgi:ankyrin repeat protein
MAMLLVAHGADHRARNRRGARPLHYAADANRWDRKRQGEVIAYLLSIGAEANAVDASGVAALHRAVRTRSEAAVRALLDGGADVRQRNKAGSMPLHLAVQTTGRGGSGSDEAKGQQAAIIRLLLERGAKTSDRDGKGKRVDEGVKSTWVRSVLMEE